MLNERGYERETNCSGILRTTSKILRTQRVHQACCICVHANELTAAWADPPKLIYCIIPLYYMYRKKSAFRLVDQKWYALRPANFVNMSIYCSGTFPCFSHVYKGNVQHVTAGKVRRDLFVQLYGRSALVSPINGTVAQRSCDVQY